MRFDGRLAGPLCFLLGALAVSADALPRGAHAQARAPDDTYHLRADRLSGSATSDEDVYTAVHVTVEHGPTTVQRCWGEQRRLPAIYKCISNWHGEQQLPASHLGRWTCGLLLHGRGARPGKLGGYVLN